MIVLAPRIEDAVIDADAGALVVRHADYPSPRVGDGCRVVTWPTFAAAPEAHLRGIKRLVVVGLGRILSPSNRTKVGPLLLRPLPGVERVSVDRTLFFGEPWRAWWHFGCVGAPFGIYSYSYLVESHWRGAQEGAREDPVSLAQIVKHGRGVIRALAPRFFGDFAHRVVPLGADAHAAYAEEKARAFEHEHTSAALLARLGAFAQKLCPERSVPPERALWRGIGEVPPIVHTDLAVDAWLVGELRSRVNLTNGIFEAFS